MATWNCDVRIQGSHKFLEVLIIGGVQRGTTAQFQMTLREVPPVTTWLSSGRHLLATGRTLPKCHFM